LAIYNAAWAIPLLPLLGALLSFGVETQRRAAHLCVVLSGLSFVVAAVLLGVRLTHAPASPFVGLLTFFSMLVVMYVIRLPTKKADRRPLVILVSFVGTFGVVATSFLPGTPHGPLSVLLSDLLITAGMAWAVWGLAYLRRSFSIIPEARRLVTGGPFALSRNPLYLGEGIASIGVVLPTFGIWHALLLAVFVTSQLLRIYWEQKVLGEAFGSEYSAYLRRVPMLVPFWPVRR